MPQLGSNERPNLKINESGLLIIITIIRLQQDF